MDLVDVAVEVKGLDHRIDELEAMIGELAYTLGYRRNWDRKTYERMKNEPIPKVEEE